MNHRSVSIAVGIALGVTCASSAFSQARPDVQVKQRQAAMALQGKYFYPMRNMVQGKIPYNADIVARNIVYMDSLARMPWDGFTPATKDLKSGATPAVFSDTAKFKEAADRYMAEVTKLAEVARKGDEASIKNQIMAVDKTCNTCHDSFRERQ
jgi:cytochrome c556